MGTIFTEYGLTSINHPYHSWLTQNVLVNKSNPTILKKYGFPNQVLASTRGNQCTLQILTRADGEQPRIAIISRREDEKAAWHPWHPGVDVYWQTNAWADTEVSVKWAKKTLAASVTDLDRFTLFLDNLTAQETDIFKSTVAELRGVNWYGSKNATDLWQVIDAGLAQMLSVVQRHRMWLDEDENADRWYGNETPYTAMERRILITHWIGDAWETLCGSNYDNSRKRCWERTGCLITADGSQDDKISPQGLPMYKVPPPIDYIHATEALPTINQALGDEDETDLNIHQEEEPEDFDSGADAPENDGDEFEDHEDDRSESAPYCGRKLKALYENGWHTGKIEYYNEHLQ